MHTLKPLLFPVIKNLSDLFDNIVVYTELKDCQNNRKYIELESKNDELEKIEPISNSIMMDHLNGNSKHFTFDFNKSILPVLTEKLENGVNYPGYIEAIQRADLSTLIVFKYDHIIGGFWLALIPFDGMPDQLKPTPFENVATNKKYTTNIHNLQHGVNLDRLIKLISLYSLTDFSTALNDLNLWDSKTPISLHGNFDAFSLCFSIETNDPDLIMNFANALNDCKNVKFPENGKLTDITGAQA